MNATWITASFTVVIAIATIAYTIGTFRLWRTTKKAQEQSEEAFKLGFITTLISVYRPVWGIPGKMFEADKTAYENIKGVTSEEFERLGRKVFPELGDKISNILERRHK